LPGYPPEWHDDCSLSSAVQTFLQDLRYGLRMAVRNRGMTLVAVFTLALGIGANTTVFSWLDRMILRPIPGAARGSELVSFESVAADGGPLPTSYLDFRDYRDHLRSISGLTAVAAAVLNIGDRDHAERAWGELVSGNYFAVLGVRPAAGRVFSREEYGDKPDGYPVVVIGYSLWQRRYNSDPRAIGSTLLINRQPLTVIGVAPPEFHGSMPGLFFEVWAPIVMEPQLNIIPESVLYDRNVRMLLGVARLGPGVSLERARAECSSLARRLAETEPKTNGGIGATLLPVRKCHFGGQTTMEGPLEILMAACGVVLLIVCTNVASLLLARATTRRKEFSMRMVMGGGRGRLVRQLLAESLVLAVLGVLAGVPLAIWMSRSFAYLMPRGAEAPVSFDMPLSGDILAFNLLICVAACVVSGIAPALQGAHTNLNEVLKESGRSGHDGARSARWRGALVVMEVAMAMIAIIGAGLFTRSFQMARRINIGFDPHNVFVAHLEWSASGYGAQERRDFCERLGKRLASEAGIVSVSWADVIPLWFFPGPIETVQVEGYVAGLSESMKIQRNIIAPGYFDLMRIPLIAGRDFNDHDNESVKRVMIVNQTFAKRFFSGREVLGRRVETLGEWYTVAGIARDSKYVKPTENAQPFFYLPMRQTFEGQMIAIHIRTMGDPESVAGLLQREVTAMDPAMRVFDSMSMTESITAGLYGQRMAAVLLSVLGAFALALAATGLYSVMAYAVAQRTQEIGIRMALGAQRADVLSLVVRRGMMLTFTGLVIGVAAALALMRLAASQLVQVSAEDPLVFVGASLFLAVVALAANYFPARRATRIDPNAALHCE